jgi:hypothetical protein
MENELTDDEINEICMFLRVIDLMKKNQEIVDTNPAMKNEIEAMSKLVKEIMDKLSDEQRDKVLETHKIQAEIVEKELQRKEKRKNK